MLGCSYALCLPVLPEAQTVPGTGVPCVAILVTYTKGTGIRYDPRRYDFACKL